MLTVSKILCFRWLKWPQISCFSCRKLCFRCLMNSWNVRLSHRNLSFEFFWRKNQIKCFSNFITYLKLSKMNLKKFRNVFLNDFLSPKINKIDYFIWGDNIWLLLGDESSLWAFKNHRYDAFPRQQNTETSLVFHWAWSQQYNLLLNTFQELPLQLIPCKPVACPAYSTTNNWKSLLAHIKSLFSFLLLILISRGFLSSDIMLPMKPCQKLICWSYPWSWTQK